MGLFWRNIPQVCHKETHKNLKAGPDDLACHHPHPRKDAGVLTLVKHTTAIANSLQPAGQQITQVDGKTKRARRSTQGTGLSLLRRVLPLPERGLLPAVPAAVRAGPLPRARSVPHPRLQAPSLPSLPPPPVSPLCSPPT